MKTTIWVLFIS